MTDMTTMTVLDDASGTSDASGAPHHGTLRLSPLFGSGAVLQRDKPIRVWGEAAAGARVCVTIDGMEAATVAGCDGTWQVTLPPHPAGGPYTLMAQADVDSDPDGGETIAANDVLYGDVWVLGGQSNMQLWMGRLYERYPDELAQAHDGNVRCFIVPETEDFHGPRRTLDGGSWLVEGRDDYAPVSGAGYFFAKRLREQVDVPIGLLQTAIGGTVIETWTAEEWVDRLGLLPPDHDKWRDDGYVQGIAERYQADFARYETAVNAMDRGLAEGWAGVDFDDAAWDELALADAYAPHPALSGPAVVWFRKTIDVPERFVGRSARMFFGTLTDADDCYVNGELVGSTGYKYPPRNYVIPRLTVRTTIAFRLRIDTNQGGGFRFGKRHRIVCGSDADVIDVDAMGPWRYAVAARTPEAPAQTFLSRYAASCYNGMIAPIGRYGVKGVLWYQGESNASRTPIRYADKMAALIQCWRETFGEPDLPFLYAQLPNIGFEARGWAKLRDEQRKALTVGNTAMIVLLGVGEDNDLHPLDKGTVGTRFARAAEALVYGADHEAMGPIVSRAWCSQGAITLRFAHCGGGLATDGTALTFEVLDAGTDRSAWRQMSGYVSSPSTVTIPLPCDRRFGEDSRVRYAWGDSPRPVLRSCEGLLASPFEVELEV